VFADNSQRVGAADGSDQLLRASPPASGASATVTGCDVLA